MRKIARILAALMLMSLLAACGSGDTETKDVDLAAFYETEAEAFGWEEGYMVDIEGDLLESYYPGLSELTAKQLVAKAPMMSAVVSELVLMQCETEEDAGEAAAILQARIDYQVGDETNPGGAWYPASIEAWKEAEVIEQGTYVALIASSEHQDELVEDFNALFV